MGGEGGAGEGEVGKEGRKRGDMGRGKRGRHGLLEYRCGFGGPLGSREYSLPALYHAENSKPTRTLRIGAGYRCGIADFLSPLASNLVGKSIVH